MTGAGVEVETVELLQFLNAFERGLAEGSLAVEGVQHDALQEITERQIVILGKGLQDFEQAPFHADAGLDPLHEILGFGGHWYQCTMVPQ